MSQSSQQSSQNAPRIFQAQFHPEDFGPDDYPPDASPQLAIRSTLFRSQPITPPDQQTPRFLFPLVLANSPPPNSKV
jgi:hypothetical protein